MFVEIIDTTLRDGEQTNGVAFTDKEKLSIAKHLLTEVKVNRIEIASARVTQGEFECASKAWLHIGDAKACLSKTKVSSPAFALKTPKSTYYLQTSLDSNLRLNKDTLKKLRMDFNGTTYNIHDETVLENGGGSSDTGNGNESGNNDGSSTEQSESCSVPASLSEADTSIKGSAYFAASISSNAYGAVFTGGSGGANADTYGGIQPGSFGVSFCYGDIKGLGRCSPTIADSEGDVGTPRIVDDESARNCWCKLTDYIPKGRQRINLDSSPWVYAALPDGYLKNMVTPSSPAEHCNDVCSLYCADRIYTSWKTRKSAFDQ